jgi:hypothetical protein
VPNPARSEGVYNAGLYLRELLRTTYRRAWHVRGYVERDRDVHHRAVAEVLAAYLRAHPRDDHPEDPLIAAHQLGALVSRALRGQTLTWQTLEVFIAAFTMDPPDAETLRAQWQRKEPGRVVVGNLAPADKPQMPRYQTVHLHEFHHLGPDGEPEYHRTVQEIRALVDGFSVHRYMFKKIGVRVETIMGGEPGDPYPYGEHVMAVDIALSRTLNRGETATLEYRTLLDGGADTPWFSRAAHQPVLNFAVRVAFHPNRLPRRVWWAEWEDYRPPRNRIIRQEPVELDAEYAVSRNLDYFDRAVVGFIWEF